MMSRLLLPEHHCTFPSTVDPSPQASPGGRDRRSLLPLARNALKKLRSLRHPDVLRFMDGSESDNAVYIVTEPVEPLTARIGTEGQQPGQGDEWKVWGLSRVVVSWRCIPRAVLLVLPLQTLRDAADDGLCCFGVIPALLSFTRRLL